ncbi:hypothetical protein G6F57_021607 [Rhizopus arrhizus]|nr:hypothetical protein G6F57_021607 [Rhizopus arrhizus]
MAAGAGGCGGRVGNRDGETGAAAQPVLRPAAVADRGLRHRLQALGRQPREFAVAAGQWFRVGSGGRLPDGRGDRVVARVGLLGASGAALAAAAGRRRGS